MEYCVPSTLLGTENIAMINMDEDSSSIQLRWMGQRSIRKNKEEYKE